MSETITGSTGEPGVRQKIIAEQDAPTLADIMTARGSDDVLDFVFTGLPDLSGDTITLRIYTRPGGTTLLTDASPSVSTLTATFTVTREAKQAFATDSAEFQRLYYYTVLLVDSSSGEDRIWFHGNYSVDPAA